LRMDGYLLDRVPVDQLVRLDPIPVGALDWCNAHKFVYAANIYNWFIIIILFLMILRMLVTWLEPIILDHVTDDMRWACRLGVIYRASYHAIFYVTVSFGVYVLLSGGVVI